MPLKNNNKYNLYTEQIIKDPDKDKDKKKKQRIALIIIISAAAALFCIFALPGIIWHANHRINAGYSEITLSNNEAAPDEEINMLVESGTGEGDSIAAYREAMDAMQGRVSDIKKSVVNVTVKNNSISEFFNNNSKTDSKPGLVIGKTKTRLVILTGSDAVDEDKQVIVITEEKKRLQGTFLSRSEAAGIALVSVKIADLTENDSNIPEVITIGSSDGISQGAGVIAYGYLKGNTESADFGIVSGIDVGDIPDFGYKIINTNIFAGEGDFGFLFNSRGSFIGVSVPGDSSETFNAIGIDDLKKLIETMSNGRQVPFTGIVGKDITDELAKEYDIPKGVYVSSVAMDSPAFKAGIQAGDIITAMQNEEIFTLDNFSDKLYNYTIGQTLKLEVRRRGGNGYTTINFNVTLTDGRKQ